MGKKTYSLSSSWGKYVAAALIIGGCIAVIVVLTKRKQDATSMSPQLSSSNETSSPSTALQQSTTTIGPSTTLVPVTTPIATTQSPEPSVSGFFSKSIYGGYNLIKFTTGASTITFPTAKTISILIMGGGGGGGNTLGAGYSGAGGGGAVGFGTLSLVSGIQYNVVVGAGGVANTSGSSTTFAGGSISETANGGGHGVPAMSSSGKYAAASGGSGGGACYDWQSSTTRGGSQTFGSGTLTYKGSSGGSTNGMGGGANASGTSGTSTAAGVGGNGYTWSITGETYGGGGRVVLVEQDHHLQNLQGKDLKDRMALTTTGVVVVVRVERTQIRGQNVKEGAGSSLLHTHNLQSLSLFSNELKRFIYLNHFQGGLRTCHSS